MSEGQSGPSYADLERVRIQLQANIEVVDRNVDRLKRWTEQEIDRLEEEMKEIGVMIVNAIERQTLAVVGGVAATTVMLEQTKRQIQDDFSETRNKLQMQLESTLQIEIGKKVSDVSATKSKLDAFISDIRHRFDNALISVTINDQLYDLNFKKITDEYNNKIQTIGAHIFQIRNEDIAPAMKAAEVPYEMAHGLPVEMDLKRLAIRSENLEESLNMLKSSRLDEVVASLDTLDETLDALAISGPLPADDNALCVEGIVTTSTLSTRLVTGQVATEVNGAPLALSPADPEFAMFEQKSVVEQITKSLAQRQFRDVNGMEIVALVKAATDLRARNLISADAHALLGDFLGSGNLQYLES